MDFGKYKYEEKKKKRESKKKQARVEVKECKFRPKIGDHDFNVRIRRAVKFLAEGNKVKLTVMFRGREHAHPEIAEALIIRAYEQIKDLGKMEFHPKKEGRDMHTLIAPLPEVFRKKALKARFGDKAVSLKTDDTEPDDEIDDEIPVTEDDLLDDNLETSDPDAENNEIVSEDKKASIPAEEAT